MDKIKNEGTFSFSICVIYFYNMSIFKKTEERPQNDSLEALREILASAFLPFNVRDIAQREIELLSRMNSSAAEFSIGVAYIEYLLSLPWNKKTEDNLDIARAERILDERHYGRGEEKKCHMAGMIRGSARIRTEP